MNAGDPNPELRWTLHGTANDVLKARSRRRLWWSLGAAAAFHGMLLGLSPTWERTGPPDPMSLGDFGIDVVALQGNSDNAGGLLPGSVGLGEPEDDPTGEEGLAAEDETEEPGEAVGADWSLARAYEARGSEALRAELERRARPVATLADSEVEPEASDGSPVNEAASGTEDEGPRIGGRYSLSEYDALTEDELLALERLSALRPELTLTARSNWILVRNPSDLEEFLSERFAVSDRGSVSVALWVDERGSVEWAEIRRSSGREDLDESALELFQEVAAFRPARRGGVNVPMAVVLSIPFPW